MVHGFVTACVPAAKRVRRPLSARCARIDCHWANPDTRGVDLALLPLLISSSFPVSVTRLAPTPGEAGQGPD